jgi:hypothetical protein
MRLQILFVFVQIIIHSPSRNIFFLKSLYLLFVLLFLSWKASVSSYVKLYISRKACLATMYNINAEEQKTERNVCFGCHSHITCRPTLGVWSIRFSVQCAMGRLCSYWFFQEGGVLYDNVTIEVKWLLLAVWRTQWITAFQLLWSGWGSSVSMHSVWLHTGGPGDRVSIPGRGKGSSSLGVQIGSEAHPAYCPMGTWDPFPGVK